MKNYTLESVVRAGAWGVLAGGAAGLALGFLLAPEEGQQLRRRVAFQLEHVANQLSTVVDQMLKPQSGNEARRTGDALVADAREKAQQIRDDIDALLVEVRRGAEPPPVDV